jgi:hypothetical protein
MIAKLYQLRFEYEKSDGVVWESLAGCWLLVAGCWLLP